jgi:hypothetical protein
MVQQFAISIGSIVFLVVGLVTINKGRKERAESTRMEEIETTQIRELSPGPVEVKGTVHGTEDASLRTAPFSATDALAVHVEVHEWHTGGEGGGNWETIFEEETAESIYVDDGTGEVLVELSADGGLNLEQDEWKVEAGDDPPESIQTYVENEPDLDLPEGHDLGPLSTGERRRYREGVLKPDEDVYVLGTARETEAGWDTRDYVIDEPTTDGDFVLSNKSEAQLVKEGKRGGLVFLAFGGLLTVVGIGLLVFPFVPA